MKVTEKIWSWFYDSTSSSCFIWQAYIRIHV